MTDFSFFSAKTTATRRPLVAVVRRSGSLPTSNFKPQTSNFKLQTYLPTLTLFLFLSSLSAQTLRGVVRDADNGQPVTGATVALQRQQREAAPISVATNPAGEFDFNNLRPGYYRCAVMAEGFESQIIAEVNIAAGKEQVLDVAVRRVSTTLPELTVTASNLGRRPVQPLSEISLTRDQTLRFPSMYFDPGRLAAAYAGVAQTDDGINGMSIRGNNPGSVRWRLEGVDVVNPNHLPNAGTFSDRPAAASGGVLMFSAQLLDNSSLLTGAFPAGYGDVLGGVMDMRLRRGNTRQHEFTAQAGLIGLDLAAEGPLGKVRAGERRGSNASYLVNYRYSTVGLLSKMGVSFGDEVIDFQDLSFNLGFSGKNGSEWRVFGLGGLSQNLFDHKADSVDIKQYKDFFDIDFKSRTGILGVSNWSPLGQKSWLKTSVAVSGQSSERTAASVADLTINNGDEVQESKVSGSVTLSHRLSNQLRGLVGAVVNRQYFRADSYENNAPNEIPEHTFITAQPWAEATWLSKSEKTSVQIGVHSMLFAYRDQYNLEPRLSITQVLSKRHRFTLAAGAYSQVAPLWLQKRNLDLARAVHAGLRHTWSVADNWSVRNEVFWQRITNAGIEAGNPAFSLTNASEIQHLRQRTIGYEGLAENRGLEITLERYLSEGWFLLANTTLFDSRYQGSDQVWRSTRWNLNHLANLTAGREWLREKSEEKTRSFGLNGRVVWTGGFREMPVDAPASAVAQTTVFDARNGFSLQQPDYFRFDLRVYWKRGFAGRRNSTFAMDFQNVTMQKNVAYHYYDPFTQQVETKYQLGLIPNLSWRLEF